MRRLLLLIGAAVVVAALAAELLIPSVAEGHIEEIVSERVPGFGEVDADLSGRPIVARALLFGEVRKLTVTLSDLAGQARLFPTLRFEFRGIALDRGGLLRGNADVEAVDEARVEASLAEDDLQDLVPGVVIDLRPDGVVATVAGRTIEAEIEVRDRTLVIGVEALPEATVPLPTSDLFPCNPAISVTDQAVVIACAFNEVPSWLAAHLDEVGQ